MNKINKGYDDIENLPYDNINPTHQEFQLVNNLFKGRNNVEIFIEEFRYFIIFALLYILFSIPSVDIQLNKIIPSSKNSPYVLIIIKTILILSVLLFLKYFVLSKK